MTSASSTLPALGVLRLERYWQIYNHLLDARLPKGSPKLFPLKIDHESPLPSFWPAARTPLSPSDPPLHSPPSASTLNFPRYHKIHPPVVAAELLKQGRRLKMRWPWYYVSYHAADIRRHSTSQARLCRPSPQSSVSTSHFQQPPKSPSKWRRSHQVMKSQLSFQYMLEPEE